MKYNMIHMVQTRIIAANSLHEIHTCGILRKVAFIGLGESP